MKTQISLHIHAVWSESSLITCAFYSLLAIQRGINKNPSHTGWMYTLIWDLLSPYLKCPQQVWHMLRTYADFRVNHCGSWRMSADVRYKSADVRASVKACGLLRTFFRISWGYLFADVRSSMQVSLRTSAKACVKFWLCIFLLRTCADILDLEKIRHWRKLHMSAKILADICELLKYCHTHFEQ